MNGAELIAVERARQVNDEDWSPEHDDEHSRFQLARAARCYLKYAHSKAGRTRPMPAEWPWDEEWWKLDDDPVRNLVKAGALIAAEIDRLRRVGETTPE